MNSVEFRAQKAKVKVHDGLCRQKGKKKNKEEEEKKKKYILHSLS
jgi:hypothetical protein